MVHFCDAMWQNARVNTDPHLSFSSSHDLRRLPRWLTVLALLVGATTASAQTLEDEINPRPAVQIVEQMESGQETLLLVDRGRSREKLIQCMQGRVPGFPQAAVEDVVRETQAKFLRIVGEVLYVPAMFLMTPCEEPSMVEFLDRLDVPSGAQWLPIVRGSSR